MKNKVKIIVVVLILVIVGYFIFDNSLPDLDDNLKIEKIEIDKVNEALYIKKLSRGFSYSETYLSLSPKNEKPDNVKDYIFRGQDITLFYIVNEDKLEIFTSSEVKTPNINDFKTTIKIIKIKNNIEYIKLSKDYKNLGMKRFGQELN